ncbi:uncharacterized protein VTP21DRAFT_4965 [Calcarisporiella thermophila]|uniref:uncharacterized protein n=1 Tax=Calcarisporiella thermophila TaxID=911321 RepID=UPI00374365D7
MDPASTTTASKSGFSFPPIHNFPPFYTRQPTTSTWDHQSRLWAQIILTHHRYHRLYRLDLAESLHTSLFSNRSIKRELKMEMLREILDCMVEREEAEWVDNGKAQALIYWRKPADWATLIYQWVCDNGLNNSILTAYEIAQGENTEKAEFHGIDPLVLRRALAVLEQRGVAQTFQGSEPEDLGVKFFGNS